MSIFEGFVMGSSSRDRHVTSAPPSPSSITCGHAEVRAAAILPDMDWLIYQRIGGTPLPESQISARADGDPAAASLIGSAMAGGAIGAANAGFHMSRADRAW